MPTPLPPARRFRLSRHPLSPCAPAIAIEVSVRRPDARTLILVYDLTGPVGDLVVPPKIASERVDGLWRHTCFEAFLKPAFDDAYAEFNLSPSGAWAAYGFSGYRRSMTPLDVAAPRIEARTSAAQMIVEARLELDRLPFALDTPWRLGLSAVIEERGGALSYWALAHPAAKPDFHDQHGFLYELDAAEGP